MNNRGAGVLLAVVVAFMVFMAGMLFVNYLKPEVTNARATTGMDCSNLNISDGAKLTCLGIDLVIPYFILGIVSASIGIITARFML